MTLGAKLINLRNKKNISLQKLADDLQLSKTAISKWEADKAKPKMDNLYKLCNYYEIDVNELLKEKENISYEKAKFKGDSYVFNPNNSTINYNTSPEMLSLILENQQNISKSIQLQNDLIEKLLERK
jgi:transcriptional regulator with XRE-family HTH domain